MKTLLKKLAALWRKTDLLTKIVCAFLGAVLGLTVLILVVVRCVFGAAFILADFTSIEDYRNLILSIISVLGALSATIAAAIAYHNQRQKETANTNRHFIDAVRSLNTPDSTENPNAVYTRIEGVYALGRLADNAPNTVERERAIEILTCWFQNEMTFKGTEEDDEGEKLTDDRKIALDTLQEMLRNDERLDFFESNWKKANLSCADLGAADLWGSDLSNAILWDAALCGADLSDADLNNTTLYSVKFNDPRFDGASINDQTKLPATIWDDWEKYTDEDGFTRLRRKQNKTQQEDTP